MKFKIDENLPVLVSDVFSSAGYDSCTVLQQRRGGIHDRALIALCHAEKRILVTLDLDFSDMRSYPPQQFSGIIIFKTADQSVQRLVQLTQQCVPILQSEPIEGHLWIVEDRRVRIRGLDATKE